jgi:hypothetical protein
MQFAVVVSAPYFDAMAMKKVEYSLQKLTSSLRVRQSASRRIIVNKIKEQLVSRKKMHCGVTKIEISCKTYGDCTHL